MSKTIRRVSKSKDSGNFKKTEAIRLKNEEYEEERRATFNDSYFDDVVGEYDYVVEEYDYVVEEYYYRDYHGQHDV